MITLHHKAVTKRPEARIIVQYNSPVFYHLCAWQFMHFSLFYQCLLFPFSIYF